MSRTTLVLTATFAAIAAGALGFGRTPDGAEVTRASGGSIQTMLTPKIGLNGKSSLQREWIAVKHGSLPVRLKGTPGAKIGFETGPGYSVHYQYVADFEIELTEPITAIEVRFLTFDVWGEHGKSLLQCEIQDFDAGTHKLSAKWNMASDNEASKFYASISYVARVRTKDGKVLAADVQPVIDEARKFCAKFSEADLSAPVK